MSIYFWGVFMKIRFFACILCLVMVLAVFSACSNSGSTADTQYVEQVGGDGNDNGTDRAEGEVSTPDETGARLGKIQGYLQKNFLSEHTLPQVAGDSCVTILSVGEYTGAFVEDGTDLEVSGVAAVVIQNTGDKPIQHGTVSLGSGEEKLYTFSISTLPAGSCSLVLDTEKKLLDSSKTVTSFVADVTECEAFETNSDKIKITAKDGLLKLTNLTDSDFRGVYVRYKNFTAGNVYYGGITYSASFENVGAKGSYEYKAAHFFKDYSHIVMVQIIE